MAFLGKYGVARHIAIAIPKAGSASHAVSADWTPSAGDVKISKDLGAAANVTNLPVAIAMGNSTIWDFSLTATEMQAAQVVVTVADSATKAVDDTGFEVETYGNASAQHAFDLGTATQGVNVTSLNGDTAAAANLAKSASTIYRGTVGASPTTTTVADAGLTQSADDFWKGRILIFTSGTLAGQASDITGFTAATDTLTFTALTNAPTASDTYVIV